MRHQLFDLGYQNMKDAETTARAVKKMGALLVDIRKSPTSKDAQWKKDNIAKLLPKNYLHLSDLGNENYKGKGINLTYPERGLPRVMEFLETTDVILMCACWNRDRCHRLGVVLMLAEDYKIDSIPLTRAMVKKIAGPDPSKPQQLKLGGI